MTWLLYLSEYLIPLMIGSIIAMGLLMKRPVYDDFVDGAKEGIRTVFGILPTLIGLMVGAGMLRASGFLDALAIFLAPFTERMGMPSELLPVVLVKLVSSSAATGLALELFKTHGPDSELGLMVSVMLSCTETVFYTMSLYFMAVKVTRTRYTLVGALMATTAGIAATLVLIG